VFLVRGAPPNGCSARRNTARQLTTRRFGLLVIADRRFPLQQGPGEVTGLGVELMSSSDGRGALGLLPAYPCWWTANACRASEFEQFVMPCRRRPSQLSFAVAKWERTSTSGGWGSLGWGMAASVKSAIAPGRKTTQWVEPPNWK